MARMTTPLEHFNFHANAILIARISRRKDERTTYRVSRHGRFLVLLDEKASLISSSSSLSLTGYDGQRIGKSVNGKR